MLGTRAAASTLVYHIAYRFFLADKHLALLVHDQEEDSL
jgi:hypothetical protein